MDGTKYTIGMLTLTATVMATALLVTPTNAGPVGTVVNTDRGDYSVATARIQTGGDALYIMNNRRGLMAVMVYDNTAKEMRTKAVAPVSDAFGGGAGGAGGNPPAGGVQRGAGAR
jgi:hypothetical protein